ncbi:MAG: GNAT family N-acetyltransferase [Mojavia pulchra JT2-VF2]|uniref:GNAT family N-acetyltransferase n=1 Tax=Mojavia pulchra JT2-VF2 TaxID=287848 RepID=A0A951Q689_9NOST|nr:GNAT family N-acetyltransferase [Mojavia pulchra JT2-VF2]
MPEIETIRLRLRHFTLDDFDTLFRLYTDVEVMRYLSPRTQSQTKASLCKHIQHWENHNFGMWAVIHQYGSVKHFFSLCALCALCGSLKKLSSTNSYSLN